MKAQKDESFTVQARRLWPHPLAWLGLLLPLLVFALPQLAERYAIYLGVLLVSALATLVSRPKFSFGATQIRVGAEGVEVGGRREDGAALAAVRVHPTGSGALLELDPGQFRPSRWFEVGGVGLAHEIVTALRGDVSRVRHRFRPSSAFTFSYVAGLVAMLPLLGAGALGAPLWATLLAGVALYFGDRATRSLEIGVDGVHVRTPFRSMHLDAATLRPVTTCEVRPGRDGDVSHRLFFEDATHAVSVWVDPDDAPLICARVDEILAARARRADATPDLTERLAGRTVEDLRALGDRAETFRAEGLDHDTLIGVVEDPLATPGTRARAAIALANAGPDLRARVRVAAEESTHPQLRVALEQADADEETAQQALERLDRASP